ncbi:MAG: bifunctional [glutamine synthetase] adenylyltransferase/[glutamine synthetase]-adenylyl-L-tyrosine phosphorylase, partial [Mycobacteriaceae bacterium]
MTRTDPYRSGTPTPGRLGLIDDTAAAALTELGWTTPEHQELLWALSRAADPDLALRGLARLAETLGEGWTELEQRLRVEKPLRGKLFGVFGASTALGDHLVADADTWQLLSVEAELPSRAVIGDELLAAV